MSEEATGLPPVTAPPSQPEHTSPIDNLPVAEGTTAPENVQVIGDGAAEASFPDQEEARKAHAAEVEQAEKAKLAGKYETVEDLEKAYQEAQRKITELSQQDARTAEQDAEIKIEQHGPFADRDVAGVLEAASLDGKQLAEQWENHGQLTDEQYEALKGIGYSRQVVDTFVAGQYSMQQSANATQQQMLASARDMVGGEAQLQNLYQWAANNYTPFQQEQLNQRLADPRTWQSALKEMMFDQSQATGTAQSRPLMDATEVAPPEPAGFTSTREVLMAFEAARHNGFMSDETKAKLARTPQHLLEGVG
jgi:hypothetical protein